MNSNGIDVEGLGAFTSAVVSLAPVTDAAANASLGDWASGEQEAIRRAAGRVDRQARLAARSVTGQRTGRGGRIRAGGSGRLPNGHGTYGDLFFGAEFGGGARPNTRQFRPYRQHGYWFFPTLEADEDDSMIDAASEGLDAAADRWDN